MLLSEGPLSLLELTVFALSPVLLEFFLGKIMRLCGAEP